MHQLMYITNKKKIKKKTRLTAKDLTLWIGAALVRSDLRIVNYYQVWTEERITSLLCTNLMVRPE